MIISIKLQIYLFILNFIPFVVRTSLAMSAQIIVVITGCSKGIGQGIALSLAKDPQRRFKVYATMRNVVTNQEDTKTKAGSYFDDTLFIRELDVTKQETIDKTIKEIHEKEGRIDVLGKFRPLWVRKCLKGLYIFMIPKCYLNFSSLSPCSPVISPKR